MNTSTTYSDSAKLRSPRRAKETQTPVLISRQKLTAKMMVEEPAATLASRKITCSRDCFDLAIRFWDMEEMPIIEHAYALYLDRSNTPVCFACISIGGMAGTVVDPKVVFAHALLSAAHSVVLFHNHPSNNINPSQADRDMTRKMVAAGRVLDIPVLDHLIITLNGGYLSFADEGLL
jgi:DNA repair protein RadC